MTTDASHRHPARALLAGIVVTAVCAVPWFWTSVFAVAGFTGCFLGCSEPEPAVGVLWGSFAVLLGGAPVAAAALAGGYRMGVAVAASGVLTAGLVLALVLAQSAV